MFNPCGQFPCGNNGKCINKNRKAVCQCFHGRKGESCENIIDPCESNPCKNNGQCDSANGSYICTCFPGWTGKHCSDVLDPCKDVSCGLGSCEVYNSKPICKCPGQLTGKRCELHFDPCIPNPCKNNAICQKHYSSYRCVCATGFTGTLCSEVAERKSNQTEVSGDAQNVRNGLLITTACLLLLTLILLAYIAVHRGKKRKKRTLKSYTGSLWSSSRSVTRSRKGSYISSRSNKARKRDRISKTTISKKRTTGRASEEQKKKTKGNANANYVIPNRWKGSIDSMIKRKHSTEPKIHNEDVKLLDILGHARLY
ncbi:hypothetical protein M514_10627, partial [Trichuris suis]